MGISHRIEKKNQEKEVYITDIESGGDECDGYWEILTEKGYKGSNEFMKTIHTTGKPSNGALTLHKNVREIDLIRPQYCREIFG